jgi:hypothetical protein
MIALAIGVRLPCVAAGAIDTAKSIRMRQFLDIRVTEGTQEVAVRGMVIDVGVKRRSGIA